MTSIMENFFWHDGVLDECEFLAGAAKCSITLKVSAYENQNSSERKRYMVRFDKLNEFNISCDIDYLLDNANAGNIVDAHLVDGKFFMYLIEGFIKIKCDEVSIIEISKK
ncbi:MAG: hypothetical protein ACI9SP_004698 [Arenicella sp.]|jgi:hypothetical protein